MTAPPNIRPLTDLPNLDGFRCDGIEEDGERVPCFVWRCPHSGVYRIYFDGGNRDGYPAYEHLVGWLPMEGYER